MSGRKKVFCCKSSNINRYDRKSVEKLSIGFISRAHCAIEVCQSLQTIRNIWNGLTLIGFWPVRCSKTSKAEVHAEVHTDSLYLWVLVFHFKASFRFSASDIDQYSSWKKEWLCCPMLCFCRWGLRANPYKRDSLWRKDHQKFGRTFLHWYCTAAKSVRERKSQPFCPRLQYMNPGFAAFLRVLIFGIFAVKKILT